LVVTPAEAQAFLMGSIIEPVADFASEVDATKKGNVPKQATTNNVQAPVPALPTKPVNKKPVNAKHTAAPNIPADAVVPAENTEFVLVLNRAGVKAIADWNLVTRQLCIRVGSTAMVQNRESLGPANAALRKKLLQQKILVQQADLLAFQKEYLCDNAMQAAQLICGYSVNGKQAWRDLLGKPLADYLG
jgi:hypothetical protein